MNEDGARLRVGRNTYTLEHGKLSPWIPLTFKNGLTAIHGLCQVLLKVSEPHVHFYISPIHINPERPAMPISHPYFYSVYLAKLYGSFATLGLAEDTWALNEGVIDEHDFLDQVYQYQREREQQLWHILKKNRRGVAACVFDAADRVQHVFFRYIDEKHPAFEEAEDRIKYAIRDVYHSMDALLGKVLKGSSRDTLVLVLSDHGFKSFRRGININSWLHQNGYLVIKQGSDKRDYLQNVDWSKTTAYAIGLAGIYINRQGRERHGIVSDAQVAPLKAKLQNELGGLVDPETKERAIAQLYDLAEVNIGPYAEDAPDLVVGYNPGYRISWDGAVGITTDTVFEDNLKAWSGDHGIDPQQVPGVLFSNFNVKDTSPHIMDIAPTILDLFNLKKPSYMDGQVLQLDIPNS